ncbi:type II toxin-antitoxin system VapC family toxin [Sphingomonas nostoxanthinifaciens]|uniref:type II toxin-antitoxin system VapC family toxin n=1 Tax=Sphingomonas nostoxanthinifaciens TaxID=2872652 RepID=UPI001CC1E8FE|nr:type II toxin-antitoxin system VapC family toxin [Sphingomonas nostoxanthinifaciens]UAK25226.1 type II toxin-antitoxin system VapC family toxin [Sphingomonas nostoxanthinifaciens]
MYLLDTFVLAELRKAKAGQTDAGLTRWGAGVGRERLFMSAISLLELQSAVAELARKDRAAGEAAEAWLGNQVIPAFEGRILPVDAAVVRRRAKLGYSDPRDALIAATALEHGLTLVTRNVAAFRIGRVKLLNPWGFEPPVEEEDADWRQASRAGPAWLKNLFVRG